MHFHSIWHMYLSTCAKMTIGEPIFYWWCGLRKLPVSSIHKCLQTKSRFRFPRTPAHLRHLRKDRTLESHRRDVRRVVFMIMMLLSHRWRLTFGCFLQTSSQWFRTTKGNERFPVLILMVPFVGVPHWRVTQIPKWFGLARSLVDDNNGTNGIIPMCDTSHCGLDGGANRHRE